MPYTNSPAAEYPQFIKQITILMGYFADRLNHESSSTASRMSRAMAIFWGHFFSAGP